MTDLERGISLLWVVDSYWRTISTTHMGLSAGLVRGDRQSHGVLTAASAALVCCRYFIGVDQTHQPQPVTTGYDQVNGYDKCGPRSSASLD